MMVNTKSLRFGSGGAVRSVLLPKKDRQAVHALSRAQVFGERKSANKGQAAR